MTVETTRSAGYVLGFVCLSVDSFVYFSVFFNLFCILLFVICFSVFANLFWLRMLLFPFILFKLFRRGGEGDIKGLLIFEPRNCPRFIAAKGSSFHSFRDCRLPVARTTDCFFFWVLFLPRVIACVQDAAGRDGRHESANQSVTR